MSCKIIKTENGTILEVRDNKGNTSLLYDNLLEKYKPAEIVGDNFDFRIIYLKSTPKSIDLLL